ncbi:helix-turn-helix domain-containing protein [Micromonospora sp. NPDC005710]|uniref:AraC-like ligand-binding domain-containing protein n=1 Tax=Micromonospora sp. NPDC005710 TaxID=3157051 RepID=UPI0033C0A804
MRIDRFSTSSVPQDLRFAVWHEMTATAMISTTVTTQNANGFAAEVELLDLGAVQLSRIRYPPLRAERALRHIRRSDPGWYYLTVPVVGRLAIDHADRESAVAMGQFTIIDTSLPGVVANREVVEQVIIHLQRSEMPTRQAQLAALLARPLPLGGGLGSLMMTMARQIRDSADHYAEADVRRLAPILIDLVVSVLAQFSHPDRAGRDALHRLLHLRVLDFIDKHLADPGLTPAGVAAAHAISLRQLQTQFREQGLTIASWIKERRLDRCRRELSDEALLGRSVAVIGARWGFADATAFSRTFKQAFGLPPGEYRQLYTSRQSLR